MPNIKTPKREPAPPKAETGPLVAWGGAGDEPQLVLVAGRWWPIRRPER